MSTNRREQLLHAAVEELAPLSVGVEGRAFGVALRGVEQSKIPAYFGWKCGVPIQSGVQIRPYLDWSADCTPKISECQMPWWKCEMNGRDDLRGRERHSKWEKSQSGGGQFSDLLLNV